VSKPRQQRPTIFSEERILAEAQRDGERNIPDMSSYTPAPFEHVLIAHGELEVQRVYKHASLRIARQQATFGALLRRLQDNDGRIQRLTDSYKARSSELGREATIPFPAALHWAVILFLAIGEFPLNAVVFRLFGEAEYLTYVMASTLAILIPFIGMVIGIHLRHSAPRLAGNVLIGVATPVTIGAALYAVSVLRNTYIAAQASGGVPVAPDQAKMAWALFALNSLIFFGALAASYFTHDPDEKLDVFHAALATQRRRRNAVRKKLFAAGTRINGEIQAAKSQIEHARALTSQRVSLYRQTNTRVRRLPPPPCFRKSPEFPELNLWPEVSLDGTLDRPIPRSTSGSRPASSHRRTA
jgi:hypothetical protein